MTIIAAVDPGPTTTGLSCLSGDKVTAHWTIRRKRTETSAIVMSKMVAWLKEQHPDIVVIEGYFPESWRQIQPLASHQMAAFVCELTARVCGLGLPYLIVHPRDRMAVPVILARSYLGKQKCSEHVIDAVRHAIAAKLTVMSVMQERKKEALWKSVV